MSKLFNTALVTSVAIAGAAVVQPIGAAADTTKFTDVKETHDYYADVYTLVERGVIKGYADHTYRPNAELTRGQAAKILAIALELEIAAVTESSFTDVSDKNQYLPYIEALVKKGIINGYDDGTFKPQNTLTRGQMAKILVKGFGLTSEGGSLPFTDVTTKSGYYEDIQTLYTLGITKGNTATTFSPNEAVKRGQMASFVMRSERSTVNAPEEVEQVQEEQLTDSIVKVEGKQVVLATGSYEIPENLQGLLSVKNNVALENAAIEAIVKDDQLVDIVSLTINTQGTSESPVILNGAMEAEPVASLTPMATNIVTSFDGILKIESGYVQISNLKVDKELIISKNVKEVTITHPVKDLTILEDAEVSIKGTTDIGKITVSSVKNVQLDLEGNVGELHFTVEKAALRLGAKSKISNIFTLDGTSVDKLISNFGTVKTNIGKVNNEVIPSDVPTVDHTNDDDTTQSTGPSEGNGGNSGTKPSVPTVSTITGTVQTTTAATVLIDGKTYATDDAKIAKLLHSSNTALNGANISVVVKDNKIIEVKSLTVNSAGTIDGGQTVVTGSVIVNADEVTISNLTVKENLTLTQVVITSFTANKLVVNGETIVEEVKTAVRARNTIAALNPARFLAESTETTVTITFNDSSVATFIIKKNNITMNADGTSTFSSISVQANKAEINAGSILPEIIVSGGATSIELNATIKNIKIDSTENIEVKGNASVKNLEINSTKDVALNVEGTIENVGVQENGKISLGSTTKVGTVKSTDDKPVGDIVSNYDEVATQIDPENTVNTDEENKPFAADIKPNYDRYGYYTIDAAFTKGKQVRYLITGPGEKPSYTIGQKVDEAIVYNGEAFPILINEKYQPLPNVVIFLTEADGTILEYNLFEVQNNAAIHLRRADYKINPEEGTVTVKTIYGDSLTPESALKYVFLFSNNGVVAEETNLSNFQWEKIDGLNSITLPLINANYNKDLELHIDGFSTRNFQNYDDEMLEVIVKRFYEFANTSGRDEYDIKSMSYYILLFAQGIESAYRYNDALALFSLQTGNESIGELKKLAASISNFKLEIGPEELGLTPSKIGHLDENDLRGILSINDGKLIVNPGEIGMHEYLIYDVDGKAVKLSVGFKVNAEHEIDASYNITPLLQENKLPFTIASSNDGGRLEIVFTFEESVDDQDLELRLDNGLLGASVNEDRTTFMIYSEDGSFRGKNVNVHFKDSVYSFSIGDDGNLTLIEN